MHNTREKIKYFIGIYFPKLYKKIFLNKTDKLSLDDLKKNKTIEPELFILKDMIKENDICFDIGSYNGEYINELCKYTKKENIYAFEPIKRNYKIIKSLFPKCKIYNIALSKENQISHINIPLINNKLVYTRSKLNKSIIEKNQQDLIRHKVKCRKLDSFVYKNNITKIDFIKIDVEGSEFDVLKGSIKSLVKFMPKIIIEIENRHHGNNVFDQIIRLIENLNYEIKFFDLKTDKLMSIKYFSIENNQNEKNIGTINYINNFICLPKN